ncbi:Bax inhibitor-1/YccA family protein [archaeon]|jgi:uncharacterized YccA/Bax inhibitor family protein|nr:Bax inhibitor-1/YccA family protein [archaeon]MBT4647792.1 Bax inhibitor-1/YccA family protein [archaeon]MBT6821653.1 Bax inhibitor-1/YccA family protein [archaeon]MBT7391819.1 Bax inhibitor-1/YccA family protein [archaeon]
MRTANPVLNKKTFGHFSSFDNVNVMTIDGTVNKTFILLLLVMLPASFIWNSIFSGQIPGYYSAILFGGLILGFIFALITIFKKEWSPVTAPLYAICEGFLLGGISAFMEIVYPGIVIQAISLTFGTLFILLALYKSGTIKVTENFKLGVIAATGAIGLIYLVGFIMSFFGTSIPMIHQSGTVGIIFSLVVVAVAAMNLVLDFDFIEKGAEHKAPKYMEWYGAFGLMVTLIWLYMEILRLLSKLRSRR